MKKLMKVVAVALVVMALSMSVAPVMAAPTNGAAHSSDNSRFGGLLDLFAAVWHAAVWNAAVWRP